MQAECKIVHVLVAIATRIAVATIILIVPHNEITLCLFVCLFVCYFYVLFVMLFGYLSYLLFIYYLFIVIIMPCIYIFISHIIRHGIFIYPRENI